MNIAVVLRQVPDLIEPVEIADSGSAVDLDGATFIANESDNHALEQALLLREAGGGTVTVVALDFGDINNTLYTASAKGADQILKIPYEDQDKTPQPRAAAAMYAEAIKPLGADLVLVGAYAHDELEGSLAPLLALQLDLPYVGVIRGVHVNDDGTVRAFKEFPGAVMARMGVRPPAVLGILGAEQPPRYVPVTRIRAATKSAQFQETEVAPVHPEPVLTVAQLCPPEAGERAEILEGSEAEVAVKIAEILRGKGVIK